MLAAVLEEEVVELASRFGRYGYQRITALLRHRGWDVNHKRVERIWRREGLKVPAKQPRRGRLCLNEGSCVVCGHREGTMCGPTTSFWSVPMTAGVEAVDRHRRIHQGVPGHRGRPPHPVFRRDRDACRADGDQGSARSHPFRQQTGVYVQGCAGVAWGSGSQDVVHRAWIAMGEQLHRELQR